jgi:large subunit ribosomal protein L1
MAAAKKQAETPVEEIIDTPVVETTEQTESVETVVADKPLAKAGKRSKKALTEAEELQAKEERKEHAAEAAELPKQAHKPTRTRLERAGKKLRSATELIETGKEYSLAEGIELAGKTATTKFDSTVEIHIRLNVDPRQADQNIRGTLVLPAGTGKNVRVAVFAEADQAAAAKKAGADIAGNEDFLQQLEKGVIDFDVLIATPQVMPKLGKYARLLGPKGLMPNPKSGTVTTDVTKAVGEAKAGRVEFRVDSNGIVHCGLGKISFGAEKLMQNAETFVASIRAAKPASVKSGYVKSVFIGTTMGPSIRLTNSVVS